MDAAEIERKITLCSRRGELRPPWSRATVQFATQPTRLCSAQNGIFSCAGLGVKRCSWSWWTDRGVEGEIKHKMDRLRDVPAILTSICHGEAVSHFNHIHLRHQFGDVLVVREGETKNLIFVRLGWEQPPCWSANNRELMLDKADTITQDKLCECRGGKRCAVCAPFSPILMLLGKLKLEPRQIPSKLVQMMVKLRCIFPFALAKGKRVGIQAYVCPRVREVKFLSPPPADARTVAAAFPAASTLTKTGFRQWRGGTFLSSPFPLSTDVLLSLAAAVVDYSHFSITRTAKKGKRWARLQKAVASPSALFSTLNSGLFTIRPHSPVVYQTKRFFFLKVNVRAREWVDKKWKTHIIRISQWRHHK